MLILAGCLHPVREEADRVVCDLAAYTRDLEPALPPEKAPAAKAEGETPAKPDKQEPPAKLPQRLQFPPELPGANAEPIRLPPPTASEKERRQAIEKLFPPLPPLGPDPEPVPGPNGVPLTLADLQRLALANHPAIKQAVADVQAAEGNAIQVGLHPNPNFGYVADTIGNAATAGFQGVFFEQMIKTAGKLDLARAAASVDVANARLSLRAAQNDVMTRVRTNYFKVLVAQESMRASRALAQFADQVYLFQVDQLILAGLAAPYEPMQLRALALTARGTVVQSRESYVANWKQLAAAVGLPGLPATQVAGRVDMPIPRFDYDQVVARVVSQHTDVLTAQNGISRGRLNLRLAQVTPWPDIDLQLKFQKDYTAPPHLLTTSIQATVPVPVFDRNQGGIRQAEAQLVRAEEEPHRVRTRLINDLSDALQRYKSNRVLLEYYRDHILADQVRGYQGVLNRYWFEAAPPPKGPGLAPPPPTFQDVVNAQQLLTTTIATYLTTLGAMWQATVDVASFLQTDDLFQLSGEPLCVAPVPDLEHLAPLPCHHPCSPLPDPALLHKVDGRWPTVAPGAGRGSTPPDGGETPRPMPEMLPEPEKPEKLPERRGAASRFLPAAVSTDPQLLEAPPQVGSPPR